REKHRSPSGPSARPSTPEAASADPTQITPVATAFGVSWDQLGRNDTGCHFLTKWAAPGALIPVICGTYTEHRQYSQPVGEPAPQGLTRERKRQTACKPGSVPPEGGDGHSSGPPIAGRFSRPTRTPQPVRLLANERGVPIRSCSRRGLPCRPCRQVRGGLLPHPFTLTPQDRSPAGRFAFCGAIPGIAP